MYLYNVSFTSLYIHLILFVFVTLHVKYWTHHQMYDECHCNKSVDPNKLIDWLFRSSVSTLCLISDKGVRSGWEQTSNICIPHLFWKIQVPRAGPCALRDFCTCTDCTYCLQYITVCFFNWVIDILILITAGNVYISGNFRASNLHWWLPDRPARSG
jgi:hypothetical protein